MVRDGAAREPLPAAIVSVIMPSGWGLFDGPTDERSTRVVLSIATAPGEVLWPGKPVEVVIAA